MIVEKSNLREEDENMVNIVSQFLVENFYKKLTNSFEIVTDKNRQIKGIDSIFIIDGFEYVCDEKSTVRYINKNLQTFSLELSFIDRNGNLMDGWLVDNHKINNSFLFIYVDEAKQNILSCVEDIKKIEILLIKKEEILKYLENLGWTKEKLLKKAVQVRNNLEEYCGNIYKNHCKFVCSRQLYEQPVNVLLQRKVLRKLADKNLIFRVE